MTVLWFLSERVTTDNNKFIKKTNSRKNLFSMVLVNLLVTTKQRPSVDKNTYARLLVHNSFVLEITSRPSSLKDSDFEGDKLIFNTLSLKTARRMDSGRGLCCWRIGNVMLADV